MKLKEICLSIDEFSNDGVVHAKLTSLSIIDITDPPKDNILEEVFIFKYTIIMQILS